MLDCKTFGRLFCKIYSICNNHICKLPKWQPKHARVKKTIMAKHIKPGLLLKALIQQHGYALTDLAPKINYSREHLSTMIHSGRLPPDVVRSIGDVIGADVSEILAILGEDPQPRKSTQTSPDRCEKMEEEIKDLKKSLSEAQETINNLSAVIRALTAGKT